MVRCVANVVDDRQGGGAGVVQEPRGRLRAEPPAGRRALENDFCTPRGAANRRHAGLGRGHARARRAPGRQGRRLGAGGLQLHARPGGGVPRQERDGQRPGHARVRLRALQGAGPGHQGREPPRRGPRGRLPAGGGLRGAPLEPGADRAALRLGSHRAAVSVSLRQVHLTPPGAGTAGRQRAGLELPTRRELGHARRPLPRRGAPAAPGEVEARGLQRGDAPLHGRGRGAGIRVARRGVLRGPRGAEPRLPQRVRPGVRPVAHQPGRADDQHHHDTTTATATTTTTNTSDTDEKRCTQHKSLSPAHPHFCLAVWKPCRSGL
mmetsp:Transcript_97828/g.277296  ORF Transcript_97828/g.277296 Transcript_97828/m.277296 type:complete len:321 (+) Transcript_97828:667-1629(+)